MIYVLLFVLCLQLKNDVVSCELHYHVKNPSRLKVATKQVDFFYDKNFVFCFVTKYMQTMKIRKALVENLVCSESSNTCILSRQREIRISPPLEYSYE